jgi:gliding motility-associated-like protein
MRFFYLLFLSSLLSISINAQITITPGGTATSIINTLVSNGIVVTNPIINCGAAAYGSYTGNLQAGGIGLSNGGIILTTGSAAGAAGPNNSTLSGIDVVGYDYVDPQLTTQPGAGTPPPQLDNCRLEFDMTPICSSFNIAFVFGSEEYPEWVTGAYNDGFGIFVSGPNPLGGNYTNYNMARLPNGQLVSIDNVNSNFNSGYFNTNNTGVMQYDGYTDGLTAQLSVIPCSTYHIKIIIADAGDEVYDSGIFLGAGSFSCTTPALSINASPTTICAGASTTLTASTAASGGTYLWSPGGATTQSITVNPSTTTTYTCSYTFSTCSDITANATVTVSPIITPTFTPIGPYCSGETIPAFSISSTDGISGTWAPAINNTATTTYTFTPSAGECASTSTMSIEITPNILPSFPQVGPYCLGATIPPLTTTSTNGFSGTWLPEINNTATTTYTFTPDAGFCATTQTMSIAITLSILPTIDLGSDVTVCGISTTLTAPTGFDSYLWSNGGTTNTTTVTANGTYSCAVSEGGCNASDSIDVTLIDATISASDSVICAGDTLTLSVDGNISNAGNLIVSSNETFYTDNVRTQISAASSAGQASVYVAEETGLQPNDRVLLVVMQGLASNSSSQPEVGNYEFATIQSINGNQLTFTQVLQHSYYEPSLTKCQLIRVPTYENVTVSGTLTCNPWDGLTGGVLCFFANGQITINTNGSINADGKGFRGGQSVPSWGGGYQGESYYSSGIIGFESNNGGGGGGNAEWCHSGQGGGGGGYFVAGETAPSPCFSCGGGWTFGSCSNSGFGGSIVSLGTDKIILGSGGGSGGVDGDNPDWGGFGGNGGGIIFIKANQLSGLGMISSIGLAGDDSPGETGGGGGGSGGLIIIESPNPNPFDGSVSGGNGGKLYDSRRGGNGSNGIYRELNILGQTWYNVVWSNGASTSSINVSPTTTTTYTCTITTNGVSCTDSFTIVVNNPTIDLGSDITVCGTSTTLTAPSGFDSYLWSNVAATNTTTVTANGTYSCALTQGGCSASDSIDVTLIDATITASDSVICAGDTVTLSIPTSTTSSRTLVAQYTLTFDGPFNYVLPTEIGEVYEIEMSGVYAVFCDSWGQMDAAFAFNQGPAEANPSFMVWNGSIIRPTPNVYNPTHNYIYTNLVATNDTQNFGFTDNPYYDNCGSLTMNIYKISSGLLVSRLWSNGATTPTINVSPTTTTTYTCTTTTNGVSCPNDYTITVNNSTSSTDIQTACYSYTWIDGVIYTLSNNTATFTTTNAAGCDSLITLNLTINNNTSSTDVQTACDSYTWIDGLIYTSSNNTATFTTTNAVGCDSLITLNLTITNSTSSTDVQTACDSYTWIDGLIYTASNNTATFTTTNAVGCDSLITLNLIITPSSTNTSPISACGSYTWVINGQTYTSSGIYSGTTANCVTQALNLTISPSTTNITPISACGSYTWINNGQTYSTSGIYSGTTANCVTETLDLTITPSSTNSTIASACDSYVWNGTTYSSSGVYTGTTANCVTESLILTINPSPLTSFAPSINLFTESPQLVAFSNTSVGAVTYSWDFGDGSYSTEENPEHIFVENTNGQTITLVTETSDGCTGEYQISIEFDEVLIYYIPNTFTPDGDVYNQTFKPVFTSGFDPYNYEMLIFNRWGEILFETHDVTYGWDGKYALKNCQEGIYSYKITFKNPILDERKVVCGSINLLK